MVDNSITDLIPWHQWGETTTNNRIIRWYLATRSKVRMAHHSESAVNNFYKTESLGTICTIAMAGVIQYVPKRIYTIRSRDSLLPEPKLIRGFRISCINTKAPWNTKEAHVTMISPRTFFQRAYSLLHEWVDIHRDKGYIHVSGTADPSFWVDSFILEWEVLSSLPAK